MKLVCLAIGGNPDPSLTWYKVSAKQGLEWPRMRGKNEALSLLQSWEILGKTEFLEKH